MVQAQAHGHRLQALSLENPSKPPRPAAEIRVTVISIRAVATKVTRKATTRASRAAQVKLRMAMPVVGSKHVLVVDSLEVVWDGDPVHQPKVALSRLLGLHRHHRLHQRPSGSSHPAFKTAWAMAVQRRKRHV